MPSWVQVGDKFIPKEIYRRRSKGSMGIMIHRDCIDEFVSPIDGSVVRGRKQLNEHMKKHGVTGTSDFNNHWKEKRNEQRDYYAGKSEKHRREIRKELVRSLKRHDRT